MEICLFVISFLAAVLAVGLLRERRLRLALAVLLKILLERWRTGHANEGDSDTAVRGDGDNRL
jgi:hypothetical protein